MARPGLTTHRKFRRLARALGSPLIARGALELMWESAYECGDDYVGTAMDLEALVGWSGDTGALAAALADAGAPEGHGFIEPINTDTNDVQRFRIHDLWHHAPDYVAKRRKRELERLKRVAPSAKRRRSAPNGGQRTPSSDRQIGVERTPSPSPSPSPSHAPSPAPPPARGMGRGAGVMAGALPRDHINCRQPCERVCLSEKQHGILRERHGGTDADLDAFYRDVRARLDPGVPIGEKPWQFWDSQFAARFGSSAVVNPRTAGNAAAAARFIARGQV